MAGMAAEGREIPIADRELTRGRRGTHSDRAHHHRRWFRAPARCRSETGAPSRPRVLLSWGYAVSTASRRSMPVGDRRSKPSPRFAQLGVRGFDRLPAVDAGRRPALQAVRALLLSWGYAVSTASRRAMPAGGRRSKPSPRLFALDDARSRCASRSEKSGLLGVSLLRLRLCVTPRQGSAQRSCPGFPSHCRFQRAAVLQGSAVAGESQQSRRFSGTARHVLRARPRQRSGKGAPSPPQGSL